MRLLPILNIGMRFLAKPGPGRLFTTIAPKTKTLSLSLLPSKAHTDTATFLKESAIGLIKSDGFFVNFGKTFLWVRLS